MKKKLLFAANMASCISCLGISLLLIKEGKILVVESNKSILLIEILIASLAIILNLYFLLK